MDGLPSSFLIVFFFLIHVQPGLTAFYLYLYLLFLLVLFFSPLFALSLYIEQLIRKRGKVEKKKKRCYCSS